MATDEPETWPGDKLRDHLATRLDLFEPDLRLIETEHHVVNPDGADGFIDILARDDSGDLVVIELKRSDQTARQALHELCTHVTLLAGQRGVPTHRLRCYVVSTTWDELRRTFGRFQSISDFSVSGLQLVCSADGTPVRTEPADLPTAPRGIEAGPLHAMLMFTSEEGRTAGIDQLHTVAAEIGVADYFLILCDSVSEASLTSTPYGAYLVLGEMDLAQAVMVEGTCAEHLAALGEEEQWTIEEAALTRLLEGVRVDDLELGNPDRYLAGRDAWPASAHVGRGRYADEHVWPLDQLEGVTRATGERYSAAFGRVLRPVHRQSWDRGVDDLTHCLKDASDWPRLVSALAREIEVHADAEVRVGAFCPSNIVSSLDHVFRGGSVDVMPQLWVHYQYGDLERHIVGCLSWDGTVVTSLIETLGSVYEHIEDSFHRPGPVSDADQKLCSAHGLHYVLVEFSSEAEAVPQRLRIGDGAALVREPFDDHDPAVRPLSEFFEAHEVYLYKLASAVDRHP